MPPYIPKERRQQGGWADRLPADPHDGGPCGCDWTAPADVVTLRHRVLPTPDQERYGRATTDPPRHRADGTPEPIRAAPGG